MPRVLGIDYGSKRTGLAVTDPLQIIATALETIPTTELLGYLKAYFQKEAVETIVIGLPVNLNGTATDATASVDLFIAVLRKEFPDKKIHSLDERYTSKIALQSMIMIGTKKSHRREKGNIDKISATIILQDFMSRQH